MAVTGASMQVSLCKVKWFSDAINILVLKTSDNFDGCIPFVALILSGLFYGMVYVKA